MDWKKKKGKDYRVMVLWEEIVIVKMVMRKLDEDKVDEGMDVDVLVISIEVIGKNVKMLEDEKGREIGKDGVFISKRVGKGIGKKIVKREFWMIVDDKLNRIKVEKMLKKGWGVKKLKMRILRGINRKRRKGNRGKGKENGEWREKGKKFNRNEKK